MSEKRETQFLVKMSTEERETLRKLAQKLGVKSESRAVRMAISFTLKNHK
jgi:hypothetical protein